MLHLYVLMVLTESISSNNKVKDKQIETSNRIYMNGCTLTLHKASRLLNPPVLISTEKSRLGFYLA